MVIDETVLITGSFNFTDAAESSNAENLLTLPDPSAAATYLANWQAHSAHSKPFVLPQQAQAPLAPAPS
jgi:phosphatidylserine/phosphatidylglycerophosphate/cardiolipin synthase-like enzyme